MSVLADKCATCWISINTLNQRVFSRTQFNVKQQGQLNRKDWFLVIANHQSWVDILVLQRIFNNKIPFLKFFLKQNLIYVPFLGLAWWGLDFPFMKRYTKEQIKQNPSLKGKDLATTKKACEKFEHTPVSIMNFVEGTRFKASKSTEERQYTLSPKSGGIAFVLGAMGQRLSKLVNVTIHYPQGIPSYWDFVRGKVKQINVNVELIDIASLFSNGVFTPDYFENPEQKQIFQNWLNNLWLQKDQEMSDLNDEYSK